MKQKAKQDSALPCHVQVEIAYFWIISALEKLQLCLNFLLITQQELPFVNTSEATKKVERPNR